MIPSYKLSAAFLAVFLIGGVVGGLVVNTYHDVNLQKFFSSTNDPVAMATRINQKYSNEYQLSADEQAQITPLTRQMTQRLYELRVQFGHDILSTLDDYHQKIGAQMTPDHRAVYEKANLDRKKWMSVMLLPNPQAPDPGAR